MIRLPGMFGNVYDTPLPMPDKYLLNMYLLNPIAGKGGIHTWIGLPILDKFSTVRVGAYGIHPYTCRIFDSIDRIDSNF